jgi:MFS family permease
VRTAPRDALIADSISDFGLAFGLHRAADTAGAVLGRRFAVFLGIVALYDLGNFSDAFLVLRAQEQGLAVGDVLWTLLGFNLVYAVVSAPAGALSDRIGGKRIIIAGWIAYAGIYLGFAMAKSSIHIVAPCLCYDAYYGLTMGTAKAMVADLVPAQLRGTAYGSYHALLGIIDLPASLIAGVLWQGVGSWPGFGSAAPFYFGAATALLAALLFTAFVRDAPNRATTGNHGKQDPESAESEDGKKHVR